MKFSTWFAAVLIGTFIGVFATQYYLNIKHGPEPLYSFSKEEAALITQLSNQAQANRPAPYIGGGGAGGGGSPGGSYTIATGSIAPGAIIDLTGDVTASYKPKKKICETTNDGCNKCMRYCGDDVWSCTSVACLSGRAKCEIAAMQKGVNPKECLKHRVKP